MLKKNERISLEITGMTHEGNGVGHYEGMAIFVPGSAEGDLLNIKIVKVNKSHCYGRIEQILTPSVDRTPSDCPVSKRCGGCTFRHVTYEAELRYKQNFVQENLRRIGGFDLVCEPILPSQKIVAYRNKAQYPVRLQNGTLCAGFFAPRSHNVIDSRDCSLHPPVFHTLFQEILQFMTDNRIPAYDEATGNGIIRHIYFRRGEYSHEVMVCIIATTPNLPYADNLIHRLRKIDEHVVSIVLNINPRNTNVILGNHTKILFGKGTIRDWMCGLQFDLSPESFYQVNTLAAENLYHQAASYACLNGTQTVLDLYCGVGTIGLSMAAHAKEVIGVEVVPEAVENATENARLNGIKNARFFCGDAGTASQQLLREGIHPDVVLLDPPRKGCDLVTLEAVTQMRAYRIVYISCNSATLARDCAVLAQRGFRLKQCRPADLFPRTPHVEAVCLLERNT